MFDLEVRWRQELPSVPTTRPVKMRDLAIVRMQNLLHAYDESGRLVWTADVGDGADDGGLAANDEVVVVTSTIEITDNDGRPVSLHTRFDFFDEGAEHLGALSEEGTMRLGGLVVNRTAVHAWMNDEGLALRRLKMDDVAWGLVGEFSEVIVPFAQPWDRNVTRHGVVLIGFAGRRDGAFLWDPRTQAMTTLLEDTDVWAHGVSDDIAVFAIGPNERDTTLVAIDLATGGQIWQREDTTRGIMVCDDGLLAFVGDADRRGALIELETGDIIWSAEEPHLGFEWDVCGPIAFSRGRDTVAFEMATGRSLGRAEANSFVALQDYFVARVGRELVGFEYPDAVTDILLPQAGTQPIWRNAS